MLYYVINLYIISNEFIKLHGSLLGSDSVFMDISVDFMRSSHILPQSSLALGVYILTISIRFSVASGCVFGLV